MVPLNIYALGGNEGKGSIRAVMNSALKEKINEAVDQLRHYGFFKKFCENLKIKNYSTLWKYLNKQNYIPLFVLAELEKLSEINLRENIEYLEYGAGATKRKTKVAKELDENLASMIGAFIADGHLRYRECIWSEGRKAKHYELVFREEYKSTMETLANWINNVFEIGVQAKKEKNHYSIYVSNKIIFRYFQNIFGFKAGRKTETVTIPKMFLSASDEIKIALVKGILMFDGSVTRKHGYIELLCKSENLVLGTSKLVEELEIGLSHVSTKPDKYGRHRFRIGRQAEIKKAIIFFEEGTEKHNRLLKVVKTFKNKEF